MAQVIGKDNHNRDYISDVVKATGLTEEAAKAMCKELNKGLDDGPGTFYVVRSDDYKPYKFEGW